MTTYQMALNLIKTYRNDSSATDLVANAKRIVAECLSEKAMNSKAKLVTLIEGLGFVIEDYDFSFGSLTIFTMTGEFACEITSSTRLSAAGRFLRAA